VCGKRNARAVKPLRDRQRELEETIRGLTKDEEIECASLSVGEAAFVRLWPTLRTHGFHTFDTIPRINPSVARTKFSCPILGKADAANTFLFTEWLDKLRKVQGHVASLELAHARPTLLPSMGGSRESLIRRQCTLALLNDRAEVVAHGLMTLDPSSTLWGTRIREIREACSHLHRVGAQVGNPLQFYRSAEEGITALRAALAVVEHNRPGFESHRQQPHWPRRTAQAHEAALLQLNALAASLCNSADKLNLGADSRVTRPPALIRRLYNKCCPDPLEKEAHRSWWEIMVTLCQAAQRKGKSWPESHDRAIREVADSWEHPDWLAVLENLRYIRDHLEGPPDRYSRPYKLQQVAWHNQTKAGAELIMDISNVRRHGGLAQSDQSRSRADYGYFQRAKASPGTVRQPTLPTASLN